MVALISQSLNSVSVSGTMPDRKSNSAYFYIFSPKSTYTTYIVLNLNNGNCFTSIFFKALPCSQFSTVPHWAKSPSSTFEGKNRLAHVLKQQFTEKKT